MSSETNSDFNTQVEKLVINLKGLGLKPKVRYSSDPDYDAQSATVNYETTRCNHELTWTLLNRKHMRCTHTMTMKGELGEDGKESGTYSMSIPVTVRLDDASVQEALQAANNVLMVFAMQLTQRAFAGS